MAKFCKWKANTIIHNYSSVSQIIADHTIVADYDKIPPEYMDIVKTMMVAFPGESHSVAYRTGMELLEGINGDYACNVATGEAPTSSYVRVNNSGAGEADWYTWYAWTNHIDDNHNYDTIKNLISSYSSDSHPIHAIGFGWCWDTTWTNDVTEEKDSIYGCGWAGSSVEGPDGNLAWGLDSNDYAITGNRVCMDTYLEATEDYRLYCIAQEYPTKVIFTTSPADSATGELAYQRYLKHQRIRDYVAANSARILFDYCDILCYDDNGIPTTETWNGHIIPTITATNAGDGDIGHIGSAGAIRLAKAQWWMLARIAGWEGN